MGWLWVWWLNEQGWRIGELDNFVISVNEQKGWVGWLWSVWMSRRMNGMTVWLVLMSREDECDECVISVNEQRGWMGWLWVWSVYKQRWRTGWLWVWSVYEQRWRTGWLCDKRMWMSREDKCDECVISVTEIMNGMTGWLVLMSKDDEWDDWVWLGMIREDECDECVITVNEQGAWVGWLWSVWMSRDNEWDDWMISINEQR